MRLIDADAISWCNYDLDNYHFFIGVDKEYVDKLPTLDWKNLVPQGRWVTNEINGAPKELRDAYCSECKVNSGFNYSAAIEELNFCPNCGARMINN